MPTWLIAAALDDTKVSVVARNRGSRHVEATLLYPVSGIASSKKYSKKWLECEAHRCQRGIASGSFGLGFIARHAIRSNTGIRIVKPMTLW